jgi:hypothetical protein
VKKTVPGVEEAVVAGCCGEELLLLWCSLEAGVDGLPSLLLVVGLRRWGTALPVLWSGKMRLLCGRELLRLLLKIRGKGGGCPGLVLKERELSLVAGC